MGGGAGSGKVERGAQISFKVLAIEMGGGGGKVFSPVKRGGGTNVLRCLEEGGTKSF